MRARNIKPGFFNNETLADLSPLTRLLFIGLWCLADRDGRLEDRPKRIKKELLGYDDASTDDVNKMLSDLHDAGFVCRYEIEGNSYIQIVNFAKHQHPHMNEKPSEIPPQEVSTVQARCKHDTSTVQIRLIPDSLIPDSLIPDSLISDSRGQGLKPHPYPPLCGWEECGEGYDSPNASATNGSDTPLDTTNGSSDTPLDKRRGERKSGKPQKIQYAEFVSMTNDEHSSLVAKLGENGAERCVEILDNYKGANGKKYVSDYRAILNWVIKRYEDERDEKRKKSGNPFMDMLRGDCNDER